MLYNTLFATAWHTLSAFGADPKRLGGQLGATAILHTCGQTLIRHIHLHLLVPGGAINEQGEWAPSRESSLFPVRALSRHFRGSMVSRLRQAAQQGQLKNIPATEIDTVLNAVMSKDWIVYSKPVLTQPATLIDYLGRYTHRIGLTDQRILSIEQGKVRLSYKDYRNTNQSKTLILDEAELLRRMLLHILPQGYQRIRHYEHYRTPI